MTDIELQEKYLGKKVSYSWTKKGFGSDDAKVVGICEHIGTNPYIPEWGVEIVIDRFPITNIDIDKITLLE